MAVLGGGAVFCERGCPVGLQPQMATLSQLIERALCNVTPAMPTWSFSPNSAPARGIAAARAVPGIANTLGRWCGWWHALGTPLVDGRNGGIFFFFISLELGD